MSDLLAMVCVASADNVNELQAVRALRPRRVWIVGGAGLAAEARRLGALVRSSVPDVWVLGVGEGADVHDGNVYERSAEWAARVLVPELAEARADGLRVALNFTGGTKAATLAFERAFDWDELQYTPVGLPRLERIDRTGTVGRVDLAPLDARTLARLRDGAGVEDEEAVEAPVEAPAAVEAASSVEVPARVEAPSPEPRIDAHAPARPPERPAVACLPSAEARPPARAAEAAPPEADVSEADAPDADAADADARDADAADAGAPETAVASDGGDDRKVALKRRELHEMGRGELLNEAQRRARWDGSEGLDMVVKELLRRFPGSERDLEARIAAGRVDKKRLRDLEALLWKSFKAGEREAEALKRRRRDLARTIDKAVSYVRSQRQKQEDREAEEQRAARLGVAPTYSTVRAAAEHRIPLLAASARWAVYIDETGDQFGETDDGDLPGRVVGLVIGDGVTLPWLDPKFHASSEPPARCDEVVQAVLDAPVGVFGIGVADLPKLPGPRWVDGVLEVVAWIVRLLPLPDAGPVEVTVRIEERGHHGSGQTWGVPVRALLRELAERDPMRAARLQVAIEVVPKEVLPELAYVDGLAHAWGSRAKEAVARRNQSGLLGACLVEGDGRALRRDWDQFGRGRWPSGRAWRRLVARADAGEPHAVGGILLDRLTAACREEPKLFERYLRATLEHLDSKAVDLRALARETDWLVAAAVDEKLPGRLRLALLTGRLATRNHAGDTDDDTLPELDALSEALLVEDAPLVCLADLHRAVLATNCLDFARARAALARWVERPPEVPGLQMWARVQSSLGQHDAFQGDQAAAMERFRTADAAFARLSNPAVAAAERRHTATYAAIAAMDGDLPEDEVRALVERVTGPLDTAIPRLAVSDTDADKYAHHLLVRYLVHRGRPEERDAYVEHLTAWPRGDGHPWPLIQLYRGLLLWHTERAAARRHLLDAAQEAATGGPTVRLIGAAIAAVGVSLGMTWDDPEATLAPLRDELPGARPRIARIARSLVEPMEPLVLLAEVLPFNFR